MSAEAPPIVATRNPFRAILRNAGMLLGGRTVSAVLSLAYIALAARGLGVEGFGTLTLIHVFAQTIGDLVEFNSWQAVLHYGVKPHSEGRTADLHRVVRFSLLLDVAGAVGGTLLALALAWVFAAPMGLPPDLVGIAMVYATAILFMSSTTPIGILRLVNRFDLVAVQGAVASVVRLVGAVTAFLAGGGLVAYLAVWYVSILAGFLFMAVAAFLVLPRHPEAPFRWRGIGPFTRDMPGAWAFVWNINVASALELVTGRFALLGVGWFLGVREAAFFRIAKQLSDAAIRPSRLLVPALYPELARLWMNRDRARLARLCLQIAGSAGLFATLAFLVLALAGEPLIALIVGPDYLGAAGILLWLFGAAVIKVWGLPLEPLLISTGRAGTALRVRALFAALYVAALLPLVAHLGLPGAGIAAVGGAAVLFALQLGAVLRTRRLG